MSNSRAASSLFSPSLSHPRFFAGNRLVPTCVFVCVCVCVCVFFSFTPFPLLSLHVRVRWFRHLALLLPCRTYHDGGSCCCLPGQAVYVAPLKALARERLKDWREKFGKKMGMGVLELTGDHTPDGDALRCADLMRVFFYVYLPSPSAPQPVTPTFLSSLVLFFLSVFWLCDVDSDAHAPTNVKFSSVSPCFFLWS